MPRASKTAHPVMLDGNDGNLHRGASLFCGINQLEDSRLRSEASCTFRTRAAPPYRSGLGAA